MRTTCIYIILFLSVFTACTKDNEFSVIIDQNEINVSQLKEVAANLGWCVSPKVEKGDRIAPLTREEIKVFEDNLQKYSVYPRIKEEREIEIVSVGNQYTFLLPFATEF